MNKTNRIQEVIENCYSSAVDLPSAVVFKGKVLFNKVSKVALVYFKPIHEQWSDIRREIAYSFIGQSLSATKNKIVDSFHALFTCFIANKASLPSVEMEDLGAKLAKKNANEQRRIANEQKKRMQYEEELDAKLISQAFSIWKENCRLINNQ